MTNIDLVVIILYRYILQSNYWRIRFPNWTLRVTVFDNNSDTIINDRYVLMQHIATVWIVWNGYILKNMFRVTWTGKNYKEIAQVFIPFVDNLNIKLSEKCLLQRWIFMQIWNLICFMTCCDLYFDKTKWIK